MLTFGLLLLVWIIFNGKITIEILVFGILLSFTLTSFCMNCLGFKKKNKHSIKKNILYLEFYIVLVIEIIKANIAVLSITIKGNLKYEPCLVKFNTDLKDARLRVLLANAITLTPGTITVLQESEHFLVHCLDKSMAEGINNSCFVEILRSIEKENR